MRFFTLFLIMVIIRTSQKRRIANEDNEKRPLFDLYRTIIRFFVGSLPLPRLQYRRPIHFCGTDDCAMAYRRCLAVCARQGDQIRTKDFLLMLTPKT